MNSFPASISQWVIEWSDDLVDFFCWFRSGKTNHTEVHPRTQNRGSFVDSLPAIFTKDLDLRLIDELNSKYLTTTESDGGGS